MKWIPAFRALAPLAASGLALFSVPACMHGGPIGQARGSADRRCNPLGGGEGEDCFLPFPSSYYTHPDPKSATGLRLDLSEGALPRSRLGAPLDPTLYNHRDGFSPVATLLAYFPDRADPAYLPGPDRTEVSLQPESPVQLLRADTGERVPLFAELDANADPSRGERQTLVLQPVVRLRPKTRYIAVIQGLHRAGGGLVEPLSGFRKIRDGERADSRYDGIFKLLAKEGIARAKIQLAWDFTTGSDEAVIGRMLRMRDKALAQREPAARSSEPIRIRTVEKHPDSMRDISIRLTGTFEVPSFLEDGNGNRLKLAKDGEPELDSLHRFPLTIHVPECVESQPGPFPVVIYGHGTFSSGRDEMGRPVSRRMANRLCMIEVGTDWLGRAKGDLLFYLLRVLPNWNNFSQVTDRLQQAHVNVATLARYIRRGELERIPALQRDGRSLVDSSKIYYYGISEGGCQGVTALALSPDIEKGAMNVPCGFWSMFFWRSSDFHTTRKILNLAYPDPMDQEKLLTLSQLLWDYTDPANYGGHLIHDPLPGNEPKRVLYQEGINDASVPNLTTRAMVRTIGLKLLRPRVEAVDGVQEADGPLDSAYVQFDVGVRPRLGRNNVPPPTSEVHEDIRLLDAAQQQVVQFLSGDGPVRDTCGGKPCEFHLFGG